jgi:hypothetical protein
LRIRYIAGSDDSLDFQEICNLRKEPTSEKSPRIENTACLKISASVNN